MARLRDRWVAAVARLAAASTSRRVASAALAVASLLLVAGWAWWTVGALAPRGVAVAAAAGPVAAAEHDGSLAIDYQRRVERSFEERIEGLLAPIVGDGKAVVRVAATIDFSRTERTEELVDPDRTALRKSQAVREAAPRTRGGATASPAAVERRDDAQEFEVSRTTSRTIAPMGAVKQLSVAVAVDGTYRDEGGARVFVPRPDAELETLKTLVASAIGISDERGDRLEITSAPFQGSPATPGDGVAGVAGGSASTLLGRLLGAVLVVAVLALVVRPIARALAPSPGAPAGTEIVVRGRGDADELARENVALVQQHPERAAQLIRQWLVDDGERAA
jgi:flagellar M-ring protein FliF